VIKARDVRITLEMGPVAALDMRFVSIHFPAFLRGGERDTVRSSAARNSKSRSP
jgi:hypothetical protein